MVVPLLRKHHRAVVVILRCASRAGDAFGSSDLSSTAITDTRPKAKAPAIAMSKPTRSTLVLPSMMNIGARIPDATQ